MRIGPYTLPNNLAVAPMAGVTDRPFRQLCKRLGAGYAVSEMVASNPQLRGTDKSRRRIDHAGEVAPIAVQIAGADPLQMADAARYNVRQGAQIIDINMGCPAKKVCNAAAGSALLANEKLVAAILDAVVAAVDVPVTLKIRTGPNPALRNAPAIARIAQDAGVAAEVFHEGDAGRGVSVARPGAREVALGFRLVSGGQIERPAQRVDEKRDFRQRKRDGSLHRIQRRAPAGERTTELGIRAARGQCHFQPAPSEIHG